MTLEEKQGEFAKSLVKLLTWIEVNGYTVTLGEAYRPDWVAKEYAARGMGTVNSLHTKRLAIDLNLFLNGVYLIRKEDYKPAGEFWESLSTPDVQTRWGGRFWPIDVDHFSVEHDGVR